MRTHLLPLVLLFAACAPHHHETSTVTPPPPPSRPVSIQVEVYDPVTNYVWENVGVRILEAEQELTGLVYTSPYEDWYLTDANGLVYLDEYALADAAVGFAEDGYGAALIGAREFEDEATVWIQVAAEGFTPVIVGVPISWDSPDMFVSVPFN